MSRAGLDRKQCAPNQSNAYCHVGQTAHLCHLWLYNLHAFRAMEQTSAALGADKQAELMEFNAISLWPAQVKAKVKVRTFGRWANLHFPTR